MQLEIMRKENERFKEESSERMGKIEKINRNVDFLREVHSQVDYLYSNQSKILSEMNNTLNWATTIVVGVFFFSSSHLLTTRSILDFIFFPFSLINFTILILLFVLYKLTNVAYHKLMIKVLDNTTSVHFKMKKAMLNIDDVSIENDFCNFNKLDPNIDYFKKHLFKVFRITMYIFAEAMLLMPAYFILRLIF